MPRPSPENSNHWSDSIAGHGKRNAHDSKFDPSAVRGLLGKAFLTAITSDFRQHGRRTIVRLRNHRGHDYLRLVAALLPQEYRLKEVSFQDVSDQELAAVLTAIRAAIAEKEKEQSGGSPSGARAEREALRMHGCNPVNLCDRRRD